MMQKCLNDNVGDGTQSGGGNFVCGIDELASHAANGEVYRFPATWSGGRGQLINSFSGSIRITHLG